MVLSRYFIKNFCDVQQYVGIEGHYKRLIASFGAEDMGIKKIIVEDDIPEGTFAELEAFGASIR